MSNDFELDPALEAQTDNDGAVPLLSGYEVLGRILAQHGPVKYTKALLDSGDIPAGTVIESLTGPIQEAGEGMIAKVENTGTGEATVTVQVSSIGISVGFACKGVVLYVEDPDTKEDVAYTYLDLHGHPAWIRAEGGATNSFVTFEIQSIISSASSVQAVINTKALARVIDLENAISEHNTSPACHQDIRAALSNKADKGPPQVYDLPLVDGYSLGVDGAGYGKTQEGIVCVYFSVYGNFEASASNIGGDAFATLPEGFRPTGKIPVPVVQQDIPGPDWVKVIVHPDGSMRYYGNGSTTAIYGSVSFVTN